MKYRKEIISGIVVILIILLYTFLTNSFKTFTHPDCIGESKLDFGGGESWTPCHYKAAKTNNDPTICWKSFGKYSSESDRCLYSYAINKSDIDICDMILKDYFSDDCYLDLYHFNPDKACSGINDRYKKGICISRVKGSEGDLDYCENEAIDKDACFFSAAIKLKRPSLCDTISSDDSEHSRCLLGLAQRLLDLKVCNFSRNTDSKDHCIYSTSLTLSDAEGCLLINNKEFKETCIRKL